MAWAGCHSARRGRAMCPALKRSPGKEVRRAPFQALRRRTELNLLLVKFCPVMAAVEAPSRSLKLSLLFLADSISVYCSWDFLLP